MFDLKLFKVKNEKKARGNPRCHKAPRPKYAVFKSWPRSCSVTPNHGQSRLVTHFSGKKDCLFFGSTRGVGCVTAQYSPQISITYYNLFAPIPGTGADGHTTHLSYLSHLCLGSKICVSSVQICGSNQGNQTEIKPHHTKIYIPCKPGAVPCGNTEGMPATFCFNSPII